MIESNDDKRLVNPIDDKAMHPRDSIEFDVKVFRYALLTYIFYGLLSVWELGDFVVPLPMVFIIVPLVAVIYAIRNQFVYQSLVLVVLPVVVLEELWMGGSPFFVRLLLLLAILLWSVWGSSFWWRKHLCKTPFSLQMGISQLFIIVALLDNIGYYNYLGLIIPFVGAVWYYVLNKNNVHITKDLRIILLIMLIASLYLITLGSMGLVS